MIDDHEEFAKKIKTYLDAGAAEIKSGTAYRLQLARAAALASLAPGAPRQAPQTALAGAFAGGGGSSGSCSLWKSGRLWFGILMIAAVGVAYQQWQVVQQTREIEELDAQILTSDLPIDAYLDRGFQTWLTRREP
ncbi:MAG: DUF3619 family protein [Casimicrobiaceae bacterium]